VINFESLPRRWRPAHRSRVTPVRNVAGRLIGWRARCYECLMTWQFHDGTGGDGAREDVLRDAHRHARRTEALRWPYVPPMPPMPTVARPAIPPPPATGMPWPPTWVTWQG
jgi:hypothetical protein